MNAFPLDPPIEGLSEIEQAERRGYAARLRKMPSLDVRTELEYFEDRIDQIGLWLLDDSFNSSETIAFLGYEVSELNWKCDLCDRELDYRRTRDLLPAGRSVGIDPSFIRDLKSNVDIIAVVEASGVSLKKAGREYSGACPFHQDQIPSLRVNAEKGVYYCHGCNAGGDVISYLSRFNGEEFLPTLQRLSRAAGLQLPGGVNCNG